MELVRVDPYRWLIPRQGKMRVDGLIFADDSLMRDIRSGEAVAQVANVAQLPGIVGRSIGMPDIHWGYGFAIGGVAAFDPRRGGRRVAGWRRVRHQLRRASSPVQRGWARRFRPRLSRIMDELYRLHPGGRGEGVQEVRAEASKDIRAILTRGAAWAVERGLRDRGGPASTSRTGGPSRGRIPDQVSERAIQRGRDQVGTVGSGNHFIEVGEVEEVYDGYAAQSGWASKRGRSPCSSTRDPEGWGTRSATTIWT